MLFFLAIAYSLAGIAVAVPYTFLAGGGFADLVVTMALAPAVALLLAVVLFVIKKTVKPRRHRIMLNTLAIAYVFLPIILNGCSLLTSAIGWEQASAILVALRYPSLGIIPVLVLVINMLIPSRHSHDGGESNGPPDSGFHGHEQSALQEEVSSQVLDPNNPLQLALV